MKNDDFVNGMKKMFGYSRKEVEQIIKQLPAEKLISLSNSIRNGNRIEALTILDLENVSETIDYAKGSYVKVKGDDGEHMVVTPSGPYETIGIRIDGKQIMVKKNNVTRTSKNMTSIKENVMGFGSDPILRLQALAGIQPEVTVSNIDKPFDTEFDNTQSPAQCCSDAIATLKVCLPKLLVGELSPIRAELYALTSMLNESRRKK